MKYHLIPVLVTYMYGKMLRNKICPQLHLYILSLTTLFKMTEVLNLSQLTSELPVSYFYCIYILHLYCIYIDRFSISLIKSFLYFQIFYLNLSHLDQPKPVPLLYILLCLTPDDVTGQGRASAERVNHFVFNN